MQVDRARAMAQRDEATSVQRSHTWPHGSVSTPVRVSLAESRKIAAVLAGCVGSTCQQASDMQGWLSEMHKTWRQVFFGPSCQPQTSALDVKQSSDIVK